MITHVAHAGRLMLAGLILALALGSQVLAQASLERPNAAEARQAISQLRSPYCPGFMLETCTSSLAAALRDSIFDLAEEGMSSGEIVEWMLARHGEEWRGVPMRSGPGLWAWVIPPLALLAGFAIVVGWLRASRDTRNDDVGDGPSTPSISEGQREKLAHALREWQDSGEEEI